MQNHKTKVAKKGQKHVPKHQNDLKKTREKTATYKYVINKEGNGTGKDFSRPFKEGCKEPRIMLPHDSLMTEGKQRLHLFPLPASDSSISFHC